MDAAIKSYAILRSIGQSPFGDEPNTVKGEETDGVVTASSIGLMGMVALVAVASAVLSLLMTTNVVVDIACVCLFIVAPIAVVQKVALDKLGTMRYQQNELRASVNEFAAENSRLTANVSSLNSQVTQLKGVEADLAQVVKKSGGQADRLVEIVKENGATQQKIKRRLETQVMQQVLSAVLASDTDEDFSIDAREIPQLQMRLGNIPGIVFDKANFDKLFAQKGDENLKLHDLMQLFHNLKDPIPEEENIFHYETKQLVPKQKSILGF